MNEADHNRAMIPDLDHLRCTRAVEYLFDYPEDCEVHRFDRDPSGPWLVSRIGDGRRSRHLPLFDIDDAHVERIGGDYLVSTGKEVWSRDLRAAIEALTVLDIVHLMDHPSGDRTQGSLLLHGATVVFGESQTEGHWHMVGSRDVSWCEYRRALNALARIGVVDSRWAKMSKSIGRGVLYRPKSS